MSLCLKWSRNSRSRQTRCPRRHRPGSSDAGSTTLDSDALPSESKGHEFEISPGPPVDQGLGGLRAHRFRSGSRRTTPRTRTPGSAHASKPRAVASDLQVSCKFLLTRVRRLCSIQMSRGCRYMHSKHVVVAFVLAISVPIYGSPPNTSGPVFT